MPSSARKTFPRKSLPRKSPRMNQQRMSRNRSDSARFVANVWTMDASLRTRFPGPCLQATIHMSAAKETRMCGVDQGAHRKDSASRGALIEIRLTVARNCMLVRYPYSLSILGVI